MWCQRKMLLSWMIISAFKNFILEVIVFIVVILLYIEGNISEFLFGTVIIDKLISLGNIIMYYCYKFTRKKMRLEYLYLLVCSVFLIRY